MKRYVCGFYFDHLLEQVVLIWKNKPDWQKGKLNGVGGKIEDGEIAIEAMVREFKEETGIEHKKWTELISIIGKDWQVVFFCTIGKADEFEYAQTMEEEEVAKIPVDDLDKYEYIPNLKWLIPMAIHRLKYPDEMLSTPVNTFDIRPGFVQL